MQFGHSVTQSLLRTIYYALIYPYLLYGFWSGVIHIRLIHTIFLSCRKNLFGSRCLKSIIMTPNLYFKNWIFCYCMCLTYPFLHNQLPGVLTDIFKKNDQIYDHNTRLSKRVHKLLTKTNVRKFTVGNKRVDIYNSLTDDIRNSRSSYSFKYKLTIFIMSEEVKWNSDSTVVIHYLIYIPCKHLYSIDDVKRYFLDKIV